MKRRDFVKLMSAGSTGFVAMAGSSYAVSAKDQAGTGNGSTTVAMGREPVIEWNAHLFSPDLQKYPFHPQAAYRPVVSRQPTDPLAAYLQRLDDAGIDRGVLVHPEPYGDDHSLVLDSLKREPRRLKGTSLFYPRDPKASEKLAALVKSEPNIVSTRFHAYRGKDIYLDSFTDPGVRALWKQAVDLDLVVELDMGPNFALQVGEIIRAFPGCKVLLDHLGEPHLGTGEEFANVLDLSQLSNVYMKLSNLNSIAKDSPLYESALPLTRRVIKEFGPEKMVWGGGPLAIVDTHMKGYSEADVARVKGGNLRRLLKW